MGQATRQRRIVPRVLLGRHAARLAIGGFAISLLAAACGGGSSASTKTSTPTAKGVEVSAVQSAGHGTILVSGNTLYTLKTPSQTPCAADCLKIWPALLLPAGSTAAIAGPGVDASKLGTVAQGSALQVTYAGQALYYFSQDTGPGQVTGNVNDVWGTWSDVSISVPAGASASIPSSSTPGSAATGATATTGTPGNTGTTGTTGDTHVTALPGITMAPGTTASPSTTRGTTGTTPTSRTSATTAPPTTAPPTTAPPTTQAPTTTTTVLGGGGGF